MGLQTKHQLECHGYSGIIGGLPTAAGMALAWPISNKLGKQRAVVAGLLLSVLGGLVSFLDVHNFVIVCYWSCFKRSRFHTRNVRYPRPAV